MTDPGLKGLAKLQALRSERRVGFGSGGRSGTDRARAADVAIHAAKKALPPELYNRLGIIYALRLNDVVQVKNTNVSRQLAIENLEMATSRAVPDWLSSSKEEFKGVVMRNPTREEINPIANEQAVVEFYSR